MNDLFSLLPKDLNNEQKAYNAWIQVSNKFNNVNDKINRILWLRLDNTELQSLLQLRNKLRVECELAHNEWRKTWK